MKNNIELLVLIKGRPITQYHHQGKVFVEGRAGSEYEIELRNHTAGRVEIVLSVDGLSVIDGKSAGPQSSGYLLNAHETTRIPGWILNNQQVAKFAFAGKEKSYSTQMSEGEALNNGVIGVMAFAEKKPHYVPYNPVYHYIQPQHFYQNSLVRTVYDSVNVGTVLSDNSIGSWSANSAMPESFNLTSSSNAACFGASASASGGTIHQRRVPTPSMLREAREAQSSIVEQSLGTAFGESTDFATTKVSFDRAEMIAMLELYYDEARGLRARGIEITKGRGKRHQKEPRAFPALQEGCQPPPGWKG